MGENGWRAASPKESRPPPNPKCTLPPPPRLRHRSGGSRRAPRASLPRARGLYEDHVMKATPPFRRASSGARRKKRSACSAVPSA